MTIKVPKGTGEDRRRAVRLQAARAGAGRPQEPDLSPSRWSARRAWRGWICSASGDAAGAEVFIDGAAKGTIPNSFELPAGRHQVEIKKAGFKPFSDWFDLGEGERRTRDVMLERAEAPTGTLLVNSDAGGEVFVDGQRKDAAPAIITGLPAGDHVVEVRKEGLAALAPDGDRSAQASRSRSRPSSAPPPATPACASSRTSPTSRSSSTASPRGRRRSPIAARSSPASTSSAGGSGGSSRWSRPCASRPARTPSSASGWRWRRPIARARR